jgi:phosphoglycerate dehydrogenase-like enzyme
LDPSKICQLARIKVKRLLQIRVNTEAKTVRVGGTLGNIGVVAAFSKGVIITNASSGYVPAVAEFTLAMLICSLKEIIPEYLAMRDRLGNYSVVKGQELYGATVGLIELGKISSELVRLLRPFRVYILAYDL